MSSALDPSAAEARAVEAAQRGDVAAFNQLVLAYQAAVYSVALRTLGSPEEAEDIAQDTFVSAYRSIREFRGGSFKAWLLRIAVNACYDVLRRRQRRPSSSLEALAEHAEGEFAVPDQAVGPELSALGSETARVIEEGLATLPEEQRLLILLCDVQGLNYEEAADAMQIALGTVKSRLSRGRARLREYLAERGELPGDVRRHSE